MADRPFTIIECEQGTPEWFASRCGLVTASVADDMLAKTKTGWGAGRKNLKARLVVERLTQRPAEEGFVSAEMKRGTELEPEARGEYEAASGNLVTEVGFLRHATLPIGCSPDGIIGDWEGGLEIKCPNSATHLEYLKLRGEVPAKYVPQLRHSLFVTGLPFWHFVSYDPRFPEPLRLYQARMVANPMELERYGIELEAFLSEVAAEYDEVSALLKAKAA